MSIDFGDFSVTLPDETHLANNYALIGSDYWFDKFFVAQIPRDFSAAGLICLGDFSMRDAFKKLKKVQENLEEAPLMGRVSILQPAKTESDRRELLVLFEFAEDLVYWKLRYT